MMEQGARDGAARQRAMDLMAEVDEPVIPVSKIVFRVHSQSRGGYYTVARRNKGWACTCSQFELLQSECKHIWAVKIWRAPTGLSPWSRSETSVPKTYSQDWPAYDSAQQAEHVLFDPLLWSLLEIVPESARPVGAMGRKPIPLRIQLLMAVKKVHLGESTRRARGLLKVVYGSGTGCIRNVPNYAVPSRLFNRADAGDVLLELIRTSAQPLKELEDGGTVAVDSSGFCTTCMGSYCTEKHDPGRKHRWVKAHIIIGVKTHVVLDVVVTDENGADCPQFAELLAGVKAAGFTPDTVVADKAYLSYENFRLVDELGATAYIPFKVNSISNEVRRLRGVKTPTAWDRAYHLFQANREQFATKYHRRSNVEAVFSAIKRKLGEALLSKNPLARFNELLAKILAYNIGVIVHEIHEHGIEPAFAGLGSPPTRPATPPPVADPAEVGLEPSCDSIEKAVTEVGEGLE
jgi:transposase